MNAKKEFKFKWSFGNTDPLQISLSQQRSKKVPHDYILVGKVQLAIRSATPPIAQAVCFAVIFKISECSMSEELC